MKRSIYSIELVFSFVYKLVNSIYESSSEIALVFEKEVLFLLTLEIVNLEDVT